MQEEFSIFLSLWFPSFQLTALNATPSSEEIGRGWGYPGNSVGFKKLREAFLIGHPSLWSAQKH